MKLRKPWMIELAARLGVWVVRGWMSTPRMRTESFGQRNKPWDPTVSERFIYIFWHENILSLGKFSSVAPMTLLTSRSADGELAARLCECAGYRTIRGSTSNGGMDAAEELVQVGRESHLCIIPDGPRGPRRVIKRGLTYVAAWTGLRIVPLGIGFDRPWRVKSWDRTVIPRPFSRMTLVGAPAIHVPAGLGKREMEQFRLQIEQSLNTASDIAQDWAEGRCDTPHWPAQAVAA